MLKILLLSASAALLAPCAWSAAPTEDTALTIYSSARPGGVPAEYYRPQPGQGAPSASGVPGYAMVRQERNVQLSAGRTQLQFTDVAALIDPTTVTFTSLTEPDARVLEQNFQFDLVSTDKLLLKYIDKPVTVERSGTAGGNVTGTLISSADGLVLRGTDGSITALRDYSALRFPDLPGGLISRPTLQWDIAATRGGEHRARVTYQTGGVTWWADYNLLYQDGKDPGSGFVDLSSWVSIINQSGASYPDAKLKLIAGDVHRTPVPQRVVMDRIQTMAAKADAGFEEQAFDEFHLYTLGRRTSLPNNSTKQIELFDQARRVPAQRLLVFAANPGFFGGPVPYEGRDSQPTGNTKVNTYLQLRNDKASGLGVPLPAGRVRVSRLDPADNSLEFIGEDVIDHTPRDERVRVRLGSAFDVVGERKQLNFSSDSKARWMEEEIEVELRNHKDQAVEVQVRETLFRWNNWKILSSSQPYTKEDANTIAAAVKVAANGSATLRYRVRYTW
ncbi:MAG: DUF4139 domain-containing protein [Pseudomonadota bacterium]